MGSELLQKVNEVVKETVTERPYYLEDFEGKVRIGIVTSESTNVNTLVSKVEDAEDAVKKLLASAKDGVNGEIE